MEKSTVFEKTYIQYMSQISHIGLMPRAERLGDEFAGDALVIPFYEKPFRISTEGVLDQTGKRADFAISVVLFQYVFFCRSEIPTVGDWVTYRDFKDAGPLAGYFISNNNKIIETRENRGEIEPSYESAPVPKLLEMLKLLPKTNCKECHQPTCMVFASMAAEGLKGARNCPSLDDANSKRLSEYMSRFRLFL